MDAKRLSETKGMLKRRQSVDRSAPLVDDAAHPGSGGVLRAISAGHFDLKHVEAEHDASAPILEQGTGFHTDVRPAVFADIQKPGKRASLKETNTNDRSAPVIEKFPMDIKKPPPRKIVVDELKEKKNVIDAMHQHNELHTKSEIEKHTRPDLMSEMKSFKGFIEEKNDYAAKTSKAEMEKKVHQPLMAELHKKASQIEEFVGMAAAHQSEDNFRSQVNNGLMNEIKQKRPSISALTKSHNQHSGMINVM